MADVQELMFHVVEPAAQEYWAAVGWILDHEGEHYFRPESDEEWLAVENAAFMVAEAGNLLMMPERTLDDAGRVLAAEVVFAIREEFALSLEDVVFRRMMIGLDADQGRPLYDEIAALAAAELGWSPATLKQQLDELRGYAESLRVG